MTMKVENLDDLISNKDKQMDVYQRELEREREIRLQMDKEYTEKLEI